VALSLREIGWRGRIICLADQNEHGAVTQHWPEICETQPATYRQPSDLVGVINGYVEPSISKVLFFNDERFMPQFLRGGEAVGLENASMLLGSAEHLETILDRRAFYSFLESNKLGPVPHTVGSDVDPFALFPDGFRVRVWESWKGIERLPRGCNILNREELAEWRDTAAAAGLGEDQWGYQELLRTEVKECFSVSGWHDPQNRSYFVTRWLAKSNQNGVVIERVDDPGGLEATARAILEGLNYHGVFELELLRDRREGIFRAIEINPRFWMQHRLIARLSGNALVGRYVDWPLGYNDAIQSGSCRYWLNSDYVIRRLARCRDLQLWSYLPRAEWGVPPGRTLRLLVSRHMTRSSGN
jgi:hypothetical protein